MTTKSILDAKELNEHFSQGWSFVSAVPFGVSVSEGGETEHGSALAALLIIIEKHSEDKSAQQQQSTPKQEQQPDESWRYSTFGDNADNGM